MMRFCSLLLLLLLAGSPYSVRAASLYDSLAWFDDTHLAYARMINSGITIEYEFYPNGHIKTHTRRSGQTLRSRNEYYENGNHKFDTVCSENYYNWSWTYYPNGAKKKFIQLQFPSSYTQSHTKFEIIDWDASGEVSHVYYVDDRDKVVADHAYPFRPLRNVQWFKSFYDVGPIKESGLYRIDSLSGNKIKYGVWVKFFQGGQVESIGLFMNNLPWGLHYIYDSLGNQVSLKYYVNGIETNPTADDLELINPTWDESSEPFWQWRKFVREGVISSVNYGSHYYYRGVELMNVTAVSSLSANNQSNGSFAMPYMSFWSTWNKISFWYTAHGLTINEEINGSWHNVWKYDLGGQLREESIGASQVERKWYASGQQQSVERNVTYNYTPMAYFDVRNRKRDTSCFWDENGLITRMPVYGSFGQLHSTIYFKAGKASFGYESSYRRVYVTPEKGHRFELLDAEILLPGFIEVVNGRGIVEMSGQANPAKDGEWITRHERTGRIIVQQTYNNGEGMAPGKYREGYENGNPKIKGTLGENKKHIGVWKHYDIKGRITSRDRYDKDGKQIGFSWCRSCCPNKHQRYRRNVTLWIKGKSYRLRRCHFSPFYD